MMGPFFFAWADVSETTFAPSNHEVFDEEIFGFEIEHTEGDFASLTLDVVNPRIGLLNAGRQTWAWLAWSDDASPGTVPLFFGRLVGIPQEMQKDIVRLKFIARPNDYIAQRQTLADSLKVQPFYDLLWLDESQRDNPDSVLEARSALWHVDRLTHVVTISDIITGEDGTFIPQTVFNDSVSMTFSQAPARKVKVEAELFWEQTAIGSVDLKQSIMDACVTAGTTKVGVITSYTGDGLEKDWPEKDDSIGSGWKVGESSIERADGVSQVQFFLTTTGPFTGLTLFKTVS